MESVAAVGILARNVVDPTVLPVIAVVLVTTSRVASCWFAVDSVGRATRWKEVVA